MNNKNYLNIEIICLNAMFKATTRECKSSPDKLWWALKRAFATGDAPRSGARPFNDLGLDHLSVTTT